MSRRMPFLILLSALTACGLGPNKSDEVTRSHETTTTTTTTTEIACPDTVGQGGTPCKKTTINSTTKVESFKADTVGTGGPP